MRLNEAFYRVGREYCETYQCVNGKNQGPDDCRRERMPSVVKVQVDSLFVFSIITDSATRRQEYQKVDGDSRNSCSHIKRDSSQSAMSYGMGHWTEGLTNAQCKLHLTLLGIVVAAVVNFILK